MSNRVTINLNDGDLEAIDRLGVLLAIKPGGGRPGKNDPAVTNRSEVIRLSIYRALRAVEITNSRNQPVEATD